MNEKPHRIRAVSVAACAPQSTIKKWLDDPQLKLTLLQEQTGTWREFSTADALTIAAVAEVSRAGREPKHAKHLWHRLADALGVLESEGLTGETESQGRFVVGALWAPDDDPLVAPEDDHDHTISAVVCAAADLSQVVSSRNSLSEATTWIVVDVIGLWRRFHVRLTSATQRGES